ncbi:ABC transporter permease [Notoacmeibacter sp. MSK16QG-6]|uniref:ABC transporter permease n=1 Tax=Notoacmeibacter sp. MSK16QG-6 TaxID=2957982 RepID=UPI0035306192
MGRSLLRLLPQIVSLLALIGLVSVFFPTFLQIDFSDGRLVGPMIDIVKRGAPVALLAVGMTLVIATRGIDLSVGTVMAICGAAAAWAVSSGYGTVPSLILALLVGLAAGLWNGILVSVIGIQPIVATLILMTAGRGIAQLITEGRILTFSDPDFATIGSGTLFGVPFPVVLWLLTGIGFALMMRWTALGLLIESVGINRRASALIGINARVLLIAVYMASGLCAAIAGLVVTADIRGADANNAGLWLELDAILAVVIGGNSLLGGRFSITASILGAMIIQTIDTGILLAGFPSEYNLVIKAVLVLTILVVQSPNLSAQWLWARQALARRRALRDEAAPQSGPRMTERPVPESEVSR